MDKIDNSVPALNGTSGLLDERWELINRMASSATFRGSPRLQQFLLFVAERSLTGRTQEIKEHEIGWKVFGRDENYNTLEDSIVRSAARLLRKKVTDFYATEGNNETWLVEIPKGHYEVIFTKRTVGPEAAPPGPEKSVMGSTARWQIIACAFAAIALALAITSYGIWRQLQEAKHASGLTIASTVLGDDQPAKIILGDYGTVLMSVITHHVFSVEEYANRTYPDSLLAQTSSWPIREMWDGMSNGHAVYFPDARMAGAILRLSGEEKKKVAIQHARQTTVQDFRSGNLILISSNVASPWVNLITDKLNFRYRVHFEGLPPLPEFINMRPLPGEKPTYTADPGTPAVGESYGLIARVPNLSGTGKILLIQGLRYTGSQAAGDFVTDPQAAEELLRIFKVSKLGDLPDFEILIRTDSIASSHLNTRIVAYRRAGDSFH